MHTRHALQETAHGLLDLGFRRHALPTVLPGIYLAGLLPAVMTPVWICVFAFRHSTVVGVAALLCLPFMIVAGMVLVRMLLELLKTIGGLAQSIAAMVLLLFGLHDTMAEVKGPASTLASGIRATRIKREPKPRRRV